MEGIKRFFFAHQEKLRYVILGNIGLAGLNCLSRADYNLFFFIYIYYIWYLSSLNKVKQFSRILNIRKLWLKKRLTVFISYASHFLLI